MVQFPSLLPIWPDSGFWHNPNSVSFLWLPKLKSLFNQMGYVKNKQIFFNSPQFMHLFHFMQMDGGGI